MPPNAVPCFVQNGAAGHAVESFQRDCDGWAVCGVKVEWTQIAFVPEPGCADCRRALGLADAQSDAARPLCTCRHRSHGGVEWDPRCPRHRHRSERERIARRFNAELNRCAELRERRELCGGALPEENGVEAPREARHRGRAGGDAFARADEFKGAPAGRVGDRDEYALLLEQARERLGEAPHTPDELGATAARIFLGEEPVVEAHDDHGLADDLAPVIGEVGPAGADARRPGREHLAGELLHELAGDAGVVDAQGSVGLVHDEPEGELCEARGDGVPEVGERSEVPVHADIVDQATPALDAILRHDDLRLAFEDLARRALGRAGGKERSAG